MARLLGRSKELSREEIDKLLAAFQKDNPGARHPGYVKFND